MFVHTLDISTVKEGYVSWSLPNTVQVYGQVPEDTIFYSLLEGERDNIFVG